MAQLPDMVFKIKATDDASATLKKVSASVSEVEKGFKLISPAATYATIAITSLVGIAVKSIQEFAQSELALRKLNDAMKNAGVFSDAYSNHLQGVSSGLQEVTRFSDEQITSVQELLVTFGVYGERLDQATRVTLDLAETMGVDAVSAARILAKATEGNTAMLSRYGITVDETIPKSERFGVVLDQLQKKMGGRAEAAGDTIVGSFTQLKNAISDSFEAIGGFISGLGVLQKAFETLLGVIKLVSAAFTTLFGEQTVRNLDIQIDLFGQMADFLEGIGSRLPSWLGGEGLTKLAGEARQLQQLMVSQREALLKLDKKAVEEATKKYEIEQKIVSAKEQQVIWDKMIENQEAVTLQFRSEINQGLQESAELMEKLAQEQAKFNKNQKIAGAMQIGQSIAGGNASGLASGIATAAGASALASGIIGLIVELVQSMKKMPELINTMLETLVDGFAEGVPRLLDYMTGKLIDDLMNKFLPKLLGALPGIIIAAVTAPIRMLFNIGDNLGSMVEALGDSFSDGFDAIGDQISGWFDGPATAEENRERVLKELVDVFRELNDNLRGLVDGMLAELNSPEQSFEAARKGLSALKDEHGLLARDFHEATKAGDTEKAAEILNAIAANQEAQIHKAKELYDLEIERLDMEIEKATELFEMEMKNQEEIKRAAEQAISTLKGLRGTALGALGAVRSNIMGDKLGTVGNLEALQANFRNAETGEAKASAAQALAGGLQQQYSAIQALAAQGAISGEEFGRQRDQILDQLKAAEAQTTSDFDRMIAAQQKIIDKADAQMSVLQAGFDSFNVQMEAQRQELKTYFATMIQRLVEINTNLTGVHNLGWRRRDYQSNIGNIKGVIKYG